MLGNDVLLLLLMIKGYKMKELEEYEKQEGLTGEEYFDLYSDGCCDCDDTYNQVGKSVCDCAECACCLYCC